MHTYAEEGSYTTSITVNDGNGHRTTGTGSAAIADAALQVTKLTVVKAGKAAALVALFTDADPQGTVSDYKTTINWGDGTASAAPSVKNPQGPGFALGGAHSYGQHAQFTVKLTITDTGGSSVTATQTITVCRELPHADAHGSSLHQQLHFEYRLSDMLSAQHFGERPDALKRRGRRLGGLCT